MEDKEEFIHEVLNYGCFSGIVSELVYTDDCHKF
ncbi:DUF7222 domain-containing protein [Weizmannia sp. CD-2023]